MKLNKYNLVTHSFFFRFLTDRIKWFKGNMKITQDPSEPKN